MKKSTNKKAFTIQFSWIFVLFVGFLIMIFVISFITKQKSTSETEIDLEITKNMDSILTSAEQSSNTFKKISIPQTEIIRVCEEDYSAYSINNNIQRVDNSVFFMPKKMDSKIVYTWALEYSMPMKITNVLYLTSPQHMYVFINNTPPYDSLFNNVYENFPKNITHEIISSNDFEDYEGKSYDSYVFIFINKSVEINSLSFPNNPEVRKKGNVLVITYDGLNKEKGTITFYNYVPDAWQRIGSERFIDKSMMYGSIFAGDYSGYVCNTHKLLDKSKTIYTIYNYTTTQERAQVLKYECVQNHYPNSLGLLEQLIIKIDEYDDESLESIYSNAISLSLENKNLLIKGCPLIY